jgi:hypothetical protein
MPANQKSARAKSVGFDKTYQQSKFAQFRKFIDEEHIENGTSAVNIWNGTEHLDYRFEILGNTVAAYIGNSLSWTASVECEIMGMSGLLIGMTCCGELFSIDYSTGQISAYVVDAAEIVSRYSLIVLALQSGSIESLRGLVSDDVVIVQDPNVLENGPLNVNAFVQRKEEGIKVRSFSLEDSPEGPSVSFSNGWAQFTFQRINNEWIVVDAGIKSEV